MEKILESKDILKAYENIKDIIRKTPLEFNKRLSEKYSANIYIKREDLQEVRSYKIRGAYNLISSLSEEEKRRGVVCASAGNHAQGFAYSCSLLKIKGVVFMPEVTPKQKINKVRTFGGSFIEIKLIGKTFDESFVKAKEYCGKQDMVLVHPFDDNRTIAGQGTVAVEILNELNNVNFIICPIGGGGLISGVSTYGKFINSNIKIIGVDPLGAAKMDNAIKNGAPIILDKIDTFIDGAAVRKAGDLTYKIISEKVDQIVLAPEGKVCTTMIELYQNDGIIAEPAGAMSICALDLVKEEIKGKTVVCILSGGNNDISRYPEIMERSLRYEGLKHYFIIEFTQTPGELKRFVENALNSDDDITRFEYIKKTNKESGPALVGIELSKKENYELLLKRMDSLGIKYQEITEDSILYTFLV